MASQPARDDVSLRVASMAWRGDGSLAGVAARRWNQAVVIACRGDGVSTQMNRTLRRTLVVVVDP